MIKLKSNVVKATTDDDSKCGGCGWKTFTLYSFKSMLGEDCDLCASCFMEMIVDEGYQVLSKA